MLTQSLLLALKSWNHYEPGKSPGKYHQNGDHLNNAPSGIIRKTTIINSHASVEGMCYISATRHGYPSKPNQLPCVSVTLESELGHLQNFLFTNL